MEKEQLFKELKGKHPDWSDEQIWTTVSVMLSGSEVITTTGPDSTFTEDLFRTVLDKARQWLLETLPEIFEKVADFFTELIDSLPDWAKQGIKYAFKLIVNYFNGSYQY